MRNRRLQQWIWVLIYGGMFGFALGLFMQRSAGADPSVPASVLMVGGALAIVAGVAGIWWRSRRPPEPQD